MAEAAARSLSKARARAHLQPQLRPRSGAGGRDAGVGRPVDELEQELVVADVVVASTASRTPVVTRDMVKRAMKARKGRTLFFVDIAVPRNVEPSVHGIDNVYVFNVTTSRRRWPRPRARHGEAAAAETIVGDEVKQFLAWTPRPRGAADGRRDAHEGPRGAAGGARAHARGRLKHLTEGDRAASRR